MLQKIRLLGFLIFMINVMHAQEELPVVYFSDVIIEHNASANVTQYQNDFQKHWSFGGNLGLSFWNSGTNILLGPKAYYSFSPIFLVGFGLSYMYSEYRNPYTGYHSNSFGGSAMVGVRPVEYLQISVEYEGLQSNYSGFYSDEYFVNALFCGLSFVTGPVSFGVRYDVLYDLDKSLYSSPWNPFVGFYF